MFKKTDDDLVTLAIALVSLTQDTSHNITVLNENISETKSENLKLKD